MYKKSQLMDLTIKEKQEVKLIKNQKEKRLHPRPG